MLAPASGPYSVRQPEFSSPSGALYATRTPSHQRHAHGPPPGRHPARRGPKPCHLHRQGRKRRDLGRGRPPLHRLRRRHRRAQHRPPQPGRDRGREGPARPVHPHLLPGAGLRALRGTGRAPERQGPRRLRQENPVPDHRRRSGGKRHQDRARPHRPLGRDRLHRCLPRPHPADPGHDRQGRTLQDRLRPLPG
ncbi:hypothetical protein D9M68_746050 [compost metagenome]